MIIALTIFLALFCILKIYSTKNLNKEVVRDRAYLVLANIKDLNETEALDKAFTFEPFCGWQISGEDGKVSASKDYATTSTGGDFFQKDFVANGIKQKFSLCIRAFDGINASSKRQILTVLLLTGIIILLLYNSEFKNDDEETDEESSKKV